ncbi:MAG: right-handed parallel beta-helix repeat-containing protein [Minisyncoccota bacterium]
MLLRNTLIAVGTACFFIVVISFSAPNALATSTYYVKDGASGDGSEGDPFGSIVDAIDEIKKSGGKKIVLAKGSYGTAFTLPQGVELIGTGNDSVITGAIRMEDNSKLSRVTVKGGGILTARKADVSITKVKVDGALGVGIKGEEGNGTITIKDSVIKNNRKGLYLQNGNEIQMENSEVVNNREEGMDIRENVTGTIRKNEIRDNNESGIEIVIGSSDLVIRDNIFSDNGSSGIATQFFSNSKKVGDVKIDNNTIKGNKNYGIDCRTPQGGLNSDSYFLSSIAAKDNNFSNNGRADIAGKCRILTDEERAELMKKEDTETQEKEEVLEPESREIYTDEALIQRVEENTALRQAYSEQQEVKELARVEMRLKKVGEWLAYLNSSTETIAGRSALTCFIIGPNNRLQRAVAMEVSSESDVVERLRSESASLRFPSNRQKADKTLEIYRETLDTIGSTLETPRCNASLFGWLNALTFEKRPMHFQVSSDERNALSLFEAPDTLNLLFVGNIGYTAKNRSTVFKNNDHFAFSDIRERLQSYDTVIANLVSPILDERKDPAPAQNTVATLPLPARFSSVFAVNNLRLFHLGQSLLFRSNRIKGYEMTRDNLLIGTVETFGGLPETESLKTLAIKGHPLILMQYMESKESKKESFLDMISQAKQAHQIVIVYIAYNPLLSTKISEERASIARAFTEAGATLVIGTGLNNIAFSSETVGTSRIYHSLGDFWNEMLPSTDKPVGVAVRLSLDASGQPAFEEENIFISQEGKIMMAEHQGTE